MECRLFALTPYPQQIHYVAHTRAPYPPKQYHQSQHRFLLRSQNSMFIIM